MRQAEVFFFSVHFSSFSFRRLREKRRKVNNCLKALVDWNNFVRYNMPNLFLHWLTHLSSLVCSGYGIRSVRQSSTDCRHELHTPVPQTSLTEFALQTKVRSFVWVRFLKRQSSTLASHVCSCKICTTCKFLRRFGTVSALGTISTLLLACFTHLCLFILV